MLKKVGRSNYDHTRDAGESYKDSKSQLRPHEGLSIKTLFDKYRKSGQVPVVKVHPGFDQEIDDKSDPDDHVDMQKAQEMDLFDRRELRQVALEAQAQLKDKLSAMDKAAAEKKAEKQKEYDDAVAYVRSQKAEKQKSTKDVANGSKEGA